MAKIRHRTFEIYDFLQEASDALASKSACINTYAIDPSQWTFRQLSAELRPTGTVQVTFRPPVAERKDSESDLGKDLTELAELLANASRVLMDFEGVSVFDSNSVNKLAEFDGKLRTRGSRIVLCNLEPGVRASFFPHPSSKASS